MSEGVSSFGGPWLFVGIRWIPFFRPVKTKRSETVSWQCRLFPVFVGIWSFSALPSG
jgi:hypothetical protein